MEMPSFLAQLEPADRQTALNFMEEVQVPAGELLMHGAYEGECVAYVVEGEVEVHLAGAVVGRAAAGEWVGETAMFPGAERRATVYAASHCWLLALSTEGYVALRRADHPLVPVLEREILGHQLGRLRQVGDRLAEASPEASRRPPPASFFAHVAAQFGAGGLLSLQPDIDVAEQLRSLGIIDEEVPSKVAVVVARPFRARSVPAGALLCTEGEAGDAMYVLVEGSVRVVKDHGDDTVHVLASLAPGAAFGLAALHEGRGRMASCVAAERCTVLQLDAAGWAGLVADSTPVGSCFRRAMIEVLSAQLAATNLQLAAVGSEPSRLGSAVGAYEGGWGR